MSDQLKLYDDNDDAERLAAREQIHAEVRDWFPTAESLAQQLGTDARRLAQRYPAPNTAALLAQMLREQASATGVAHQLLPAHPTAQVLALVAFDEDSPVKTVASQQTRGLIRPLRQVAAAVLLVIAGWSLWQWSADKPLGPGGDINNLAAQPGDKTGLPETVLPVAIPVAPLAPQEFQTLSAPEREAVLDLLEEQALGTVSLSI